MTSLARKLNRAAKRRNGLVPDRDKPWLVDIHDTFYRVLHPTRGWRCISNKRVWAQHRMAR